MAPAFDPRSIATYAPIMTDVTQSLVAKWDALPAPREVDVAAAMMQATLHIISRAMFSSDSDEIVAAVESGVNDYQTNVRPRLLDLLHFPRMVHQPGLTRYGRITLWDYRPFLDRARSVCRAMRQMRSNC